MPGRYSAKIELGANNRDPMIHMFKGHIVRKSVLVIAYKMSVIGPLIILNSLSRKYKVHTGKFV